MDTSFALLFVFLCSGALAAVYTCVHLWFCEMACFDLSSEPTCTHRLSAVNSMQTGKYIVSACQHATFAVSCSIPAQGHMYLYIHDI